MDFILMEYLCGVLIMDLKQGKISNRYSLVALLMQMIPGVILCGFDTTINRLADSVFVFLAFMLAFAIGGIGGGDGKAFACMVAMVGLDKGLFIILFTLVFGCIYGIMKKQIEHTGKTRVKLGVFMPFAHILSMIV